MKYEYNPFLKTDRKGRNKGLQHVERKRPYSAIVFLDDNGTVIAENNNGKTIKTGTDASIVIQAASDYIGNRGGNIEILPGDYYCNSQINIGTNVNMHGHDVHNADLNYGTILIKNFTHATNDSLIRTTIYGASHISGLKLKGIGYSGYGITFSGSDNFIDSNYIVGDFYWGIYTPFTAAPLTNWNRIYKNRIYVSGHASIAMGSHDNFYWANILDNSLHTVGTIKPCMYMTADAHENMIWDNHFAGLRTGVGIQASTSPTGLKIQRNWFDNLLDGIFIYGDNHLIQGNLFYQCQNYGIELHDGSYQSIEGNRFLENNAADVNNYGDILLDSATYSSVQNNLHQGAFTGSEANTISIYESTAAPTCDYNIIAGNSVKVANYKIPNWFVGGPNSLWHHNIGINPSAIYNQGVGASPYTWTNTTGYIVTAYIRSASTVTLTITRAGATTTILTATNSTVTLYPGDAVTMTYTAGITMIIQPM